MQGFQSEYVNKDRHALQHNGHRCPQHSRKPECELLSCAEANDIPWQVLICTLMGLFRHLHHTSLVSLLWLLPDESGEKKKKKHLDNTCKVRWCHFMYYMGVVEKIKSDKSVCVCLSTCTRQRPQ